MCDCLDTNTIARGLFFCQLTGVIFVFMGVNYDPRKKAIWPPLFLLLSSKRKTLILQAFSRSVDFVNLRDT